RDPYDPWEAANLYGEWENWAFFARRTIPRRRGRPGSYQAKAAELNRLVKRLLGWSPRMLQRYAVAGALCGGALRDAIRSGAVPITAAPAVADLPRDVRNQIAGEILGGADPRATVEPYLRPRDVRHRKVGDALASWLRAL